MSGFHRSLGLWDATMLVAGSMIGSGIFIVSAGMMRDLGSPAWLLVAWVVAGVLTVLAALSYGELASMMPKAGGQFVYLERAYGRLTAFLYGWTAFTVITSGIIAAVAVAFAKFSAVFFPVLSPDNVLFDLGFVKVSAAQVYAVSAILLLTWFNTRGVESSKTFTTVFTTAKIAALLALIVVGLAVGMGTDVLATNFTDGWRAATHHVDGTLSPLTGAALLSALGVAMVGSLFSSDGWNSITFIAGEVKVPLVYVPIESIMSKWYGQSSQNLAQIFEAADEMGGAIIFLDEIDALAPSREQNMFEATRRVLSVLLRKLDGLDSASSTLTIGATNRMMDLDHALISRFDQTIHFPLPNAKERAAIFGNYAMHLGEEELAEISEMCDGLSGRTIKDICEFAERRWARMLIVKDLPPSQPDFKYYRHSVKQWTEKKV